MGRFLLASLLGVGVFVAPMSASAQVKLSESQLELDDQALGWWLGGAGTAGILAGAFTLAISDSRQAGRAHDIQVASGTALAGLGGALLIAGIYIMAAGDPGPCEISGTGLEEQAFDFRISPVGVEIVGRF